MEWINALFYGEPGAGKTYLLGTAMDHEATRPMLFIDVEGGTTTLRKRKDLDVVSVRSMPEFTSTINLLYQNPGYYKSLGVDSLSELADLDMKDVMRELIERRPDLDPDVPSQREWGIVRSHMRKITRALRDLPLHTFMTALEGTDKDDNSVITHFPAFSGKLRSEIPGFVDVVGYLYASAEGDQTIRRLQFAKTRRIIAKDRTDAFGDVIESPTIPLMWQMLNS